MDNHLKREIILENYSHPRNKGLTSDPSYLYVNMNNESCIDEIHLNVKITDEKIEDIRFDGEACAICTSATSIMIETLIGKTVTEVSHLITQYENMVNEKEYDADVLENAIVYDDIYKQPNRKKCALLPWWGIKKVVEEYQNGVEKK
ncbi:MAG: SUF system NifU family Fe-S cluster assembly protein [Bacilli bacterium]|nr:SUF system NifU family Fe-S cluster assembly protein [Bacilli bacterium]